MDAKNPGGPPRFRMVLSDGSHFQQAMLGTQVQ
jgi:hypothetical protein